MIVPAFLHDSPLKICCLGKCPVLLGERMRCTLIMSVQKSCTYSLTDCLFLGLSFLIFHVSHLDLESPLVCAFAMTLVLIYFSVGHRIPHSDCTSTETGERTAAAQYQSPGGYQTFVLFCHPFLNAFFLILTV